MLVLRGRGCCRGPPRRSRWRSRAQHSCGKSAAPPGQRCRRPRRCSPSPHTTDQGPPRWRAPIVPCRRCGAHGRAPGHPSLLGSAPQVQRGSGQAPAKRRSARVAPPPRRRAVRVGGWGRPLGRAPPGHRHGSRSSCSGRLNRGYRSRRGRRTSPRRPPRRGGQLRPRQPRSGPGRRPFGARQRWQRRPTGRRYRRRSLGWAGRRRVESSQPPQEPGWPSAAQRGRWRACDAGRDQSTPGALDARERWRREHRAREVPRHECRCGMVA